MYVILGIVAAATVTYIVAKVVSSIAIFPSQIFAKTQNLKNIQPDEKELDLSFSEEKTKENRTVHTVKITPKQTIW